MIVIALGFHFFERRTNDGFHFIKKSCAKSNTQVCIVKMIDMTPETIIAIATFGNKAVNMRIPFEVSAESMQNHNETRSKVFGFIHFEKHTGNNTINRVKEAA